MAAGQGDLGVKGKEEHLTVSIQHVEGTVRRSCKHCIGELTDFFVLTLQLKVGGKNRNAHQKCQRDYTFRATLASLPLSLLEQGFSARPVQGNLQRKATCIGAVR